MNYSDYDSDDYSSNEDEDYVPSDDNLSEDDLNECEKEEGFDAEDSGKQQSVDVKTTKKKKKQSAKGIGVRKRKKGGLKLETEEEDGGTRQEEATQEKPEGEDGEDDEGPPGPPKEMEKKKADDLWASFLSDVGPRPKLSTPASESAPSGKSPQASDPDIKTDTPSQPQELKPKAKEPSKITITKVFDFAGEEVRVTKEVEADSKEAKSFLKIQESETMKEPSPSQPLDPGPSVKRPAGVAGILGQIAGKKQKMSTLEKSRLDWDTFKSEEGIGDELATHNRGKEGYIERKNFLERVDHRRFEQEKTVRLKNMKR
ncbi:craniofacial development protein 1 [Anguilla anguilla]|uniref:craniofacial development protein 1 n=1 Tax=Anguilla anguilla TaxID=7936 RepID=UPI0015AC4055|nr:craniofacial development protein 1 [Anguilla anguilla]XP_035273368.1 craniofacial development protein 1 [Anguilla anguilla]